MMDDEIGRLKEENRRLRELIAQHGIALLPVHQSLGMIHRRCDGRIHNFRNMAVALLG
jgi:hypothetical protein